MAEPWTPGPWSVWDKRGEPYGHYEYEWRVPGGWCTKGDLIVDGHLGPKSYGVKTPRGNMTPPTFEDARLIAAAPEMAALLERCMGFATLDDTQLEEEIETLLSRIRGEA